MKQKLIKSKKRVREFAEVFTPDFIVKDMCNLIPAEMWENIETTFLEPSCGTGNFLVEILDRKYNFCQNEKDGLKALASVVGVDIQADNCHECRTRLLKQFITQFPQASELSILLASGILANNIICGDFLDPNEKLKSLGAVPDENYIKAKNRLKEKQKNAAINVKTVDNGK